jgi:hypothetical protein
MIKFMEDDETSYQYHAGVKPDVILLDILCKSGQMPSMISPIVNDTDVGIVHKDLAKAVRELEKTLTYGIMDSVKTIVNHPHLFSYLHALYDLYMMDVDPDEDDDIPNISVTLTMRCLNKIHDGGIGHTVKDSDIVHELYLSELLPQDVEFEYKRVFSLSALHDRVSDYIKNKCMPLTSI